jgi:hypothetical protein
MGSERSPVDISMLPKFQMYVYRMNTLVRVGRGRTTFTVDARDIF